MLCVLSGWFDFIDIICIDICCCFALNIYVNIMFFLQSILFDIVYYFIVLSMYFFKIAFVFAAPGKGYGLYLYLYLNF